MLHDHQIAVAPAQSRAISPLTLGAELERDRLTHRVRTILVTIDVLRQRANEWRREGGGPPGHLQRVITDFEAQVETIEARLRDLAPERAGALRLADAGRGARDVSFRTPSIPWFSTDLKR
jgi:hypothetical protein